MEHEKNDPSKTSVWSEWPTPAAAATMSQEEVEYWAIVAWQNELDYAELLREEEESARGYYMD